MTLVDLVDLTKIVHACRFGRVLILGIEAFVVSEGKITPDPDLIADFSSLESMGWERACMEASRSAEAYLQEIKNPLLWFDLVLKRRD
jgi:hypothetical protein